MERWKFSLSRCKKCNSDNLQLIEPSTNTPVCLECGLEHSEENRDFALAFPNKMIVPEWVGFFYLSATFGPDWQNLISKDILLEQLRLIMAEWQNHPPKGLMPTLR